MYNSQGTHTFRVGKQSKILEFNPTEPFWDINSYCFLPLLDP